MSINRRTFLKGIGAAAISASALRLLFALDYSGDEFTLKNNNALLRGELGEYNGIRFISRQSVSMGPIRYLKERPERKINQVKDIFRNHLKNNRITTSPDHVRFFYQVYDYGNEVGVGMVVSPVPRRDIGLTWGQMERLLKEEIRRA